MHLKTSLIVLNAMLFFALGGRAQRIFYDKGGQAVGPDEAYARYVDLEKRKMDGITSRNMAQMTP
ncbi:MAG: hypothetical protein IPL65_13650 [Lewinellaceae bacterium]|nr:hypothetical protein [Lewinellaceae bacterium]